jgi:hypothetical protein
MGILLFIVAIFLFIPLTGINLVLVIVKNPSWKTVDGYFFQTSIDIDRFGNRNFRSLLNATLILESKNTFGDPRETISSVLGKNQQTDTLTKTGQLLVKLLDWLDPNHCEKSIRWYL